MLFALALSEMQQVSASFRLVLKHCYKILVRKLLHLYKTARLEDLMNQATTYRKFENFARQLDIHLDTQAFKFRPESGLYDYERIESRYRIMKQLRKGKNIKTLAHALRQDLHKNIGGICGPELYNQCYLGTKRLIEKYHNEVIKCIQTIYLAKPSKMGLESKLSFFSETRHSYGHTALMLSGGATFGKFHFGVVKALHESDLLPKIICGSSVGSIVAAGLGTNSDFSKVSEAAA